MHIWRTQKELPYANLRESVYQCKTVMERLSKHHQLTSGPGELRLSIMLQKAQPQCVVRVECDGLHATLVTRFVLDCAHFAQEVVAMKNAVAGASQRSCPQRDPGYRTITEVSPFIWRLIGDCCLKHARNAMTACSKQLGGCKRQPIMLALMHRSS